MVKLSPVPRSFDETEAALSWMLPAALLLSEITKHKKRKSLTGLRVETLSCGHILVWRGENQWKSFWETKRRPPPRYSSVSSSETLTNSVSAHFHPGAWQRVGEACLHTLHTVCVWGGVTVYFVLSPVEAWLAAAEAVCSPLRTGSQGSNSSSSQWVCSLNPGELISDFSCFLLFSLSPVF